MGVHSTKVKGVTVKTQEIHVSGQGWQGQGDYWGDWKMNKTYSLSAHDLENLDYRDRDAVQRWLDCHTIMDFFRVDDFCVSVDAYWSDWVEYRRSPRHLGGLDD